MPAIIGDPPCDRPFGFLWTKKNCWLFTHFVKVEHITIRVMLLVHDRRETHSVISAHRVIHTESHPPSRHSGNPTTSPTWQHSDRLAYPAPWMPFSCLFFQNFDFFFFPSVIPRTRLPRDQLLSPCFFLYLIHTALQSLSKHTKKNWTVLHLPRYIYFLFVLSPSWSCRFRTTLDLQWHRSRSARPSQLQNSFWHQDPSPSIIVSQPTRSQSREESAPPNTAVCFFFK